MYIQDKERARNKSNKKNLKKFKKSLDKLLLVWYNIRVVKIKSYCNNKILKELFFMTEKKITKKDYFMQLLEIVGDSDELTSFINHEIELLDKKNLTKSVKVLEKDKEIVSKILEVLQDNKNLKCTEIAKTLEYEYSAQKISAMLKKLVDSGKVERTTEKRVSYFNIKEVE